MSKKQLIIGMPAGSLANPTRGGNLVSLLEKAGFRTKGYESGGPSRFLTTGYLFGWDGRPQEFGSQLGIGELDVAIAGDDWIREYDLSSLKFMGSTGEPFDLWDDLGSSRFYLPYGFVLERHVREITDYTKLAMEYARDLSGVQISKAWADYERLRGGVQGFFEKYGQDLFRS